MQRTIIRETLEDAGVPPADTSRAPAGGSVAWINDDATDAELTKAVAAVERNTMLTYEGQDDLDGSYQYVGLRFDWAPDAPRHRASPTNPRAVSLWSLAGEMGLSRADARRAITGLHHSGATRFWKGDPMTTPVVRCGPGVLPESETEMHRYHYYVE